MKVYMSAYTENHTTKVQFTVNAKSHDHAIHKAMVLFDNAILHLDIHTIEAHTQPCIHMDAHIQSYIIRTHGKACNGKVLMSHGTQHTPYSTPYTTHIHNNSMRTHTTLLPPHTPAHTPTR
jgi:hypothetical protein